MLAVVGFCDTTHAQLGAQPPKLGGAAGSELQQIYSRDVGYGYTVNSLNQIALTNARNQIDHYSGVYNSPSRPRVAAAAPGPMLAKPFSGYTPEPTVSPYLNLFREDVDGSSDLNYQTLVRPMLQQQQFNQQVQRQSMELSRRMQAMAAQSDFNPEGSQSQYPTGHQTVFMYYGHYYPSANIRPRR
jgi:hypothetical protein